MKNKATIYGMSYNKIWTIANFFFGLLSYKSISPKKNECPISFNFIDYKKYRIMKINCAIKIHFFSKSVNNNISIIINIDTTLLNYKKQVINFVFLLFSNLYTIY